MDSNQGPPSHPKPSPWPLISSRPGPHLFVARARFDTMENPRTGEAMERTVLEAPDWVNVVALTPERHLILVHQYRFGSGEVSTEIPGGVIDPGEDPLQAAKRELLEETGYGSENWTHLATAQPNPAFLANVCHHFLAEEVIQMRDSLALDPGEDITVSTLPLAQVRREITAGAINHSLVISALARILDLSAADCGGALDGGQSDR